MSRNFQASKTPKSTLTGGLPIPKPITFRTAVEKVQLRKCVLPCFHPAPGRHEEELCFEKKCQTVVLQSYQNIGQSFQANCGHKSARKRGVFKQ